MKTLYPENWPQFFTATIGGWKHLLKDDRFKDIIIESLQFLKVRERMEINAYVIMSNHIHFIWQALHGYDLKDIQSSFARHTAKKFLHLVSAEGGSELYKVNSPDRDHNFWKRNPLGVELFTPTVFDQKLDYIHYNPVRAGLCKYPEDYKYSSAMFYHNGEDHTGVLTHWAG
jgi:putative transposase